MRENGIIWSRIWNLFSNHCFFLPFTCKHSTCCLDKCSAEQCLSLQNSLEIHSVIQTSKNGGGEKLKSPWQGFLSCRFTRIGGRTSQITSLQAGRTALWPSLTRKASGTTFPATTTCPTSARKEQVNKKCAQWEALLLWKTWLSFINVPQRLRNPGEHFRRLWTWINFFEECQHHFSRLLFPITSLFRQIGPDVSLSCDYPLLSHASFPEAQKSSHSDTDTRLPSSGQTQLSSLSRSNVTPRLPSPASAPRLALLILPVCCGPLQCCAEPHQQWRTPTWSADGGRITTSMPRSATSALKASSSATSLPSDAGPTVAGRDPGSSVPSVSAGLKLVQVQRRGFYWLTRY